MNVKITFRRTIVYGLLAIAVALFVSWFILYEWARSYCPREPNALTGHILPQQMQQPFLVYLTQGQVDWLDYLLPLYITVALIAFYLNQRWQILKNFHSSRI